jgi:hypothetical protein
MAGISRMNLQCSEILINFFRENHGPGFRE